MKRIIGAFLVLAFLGSAILVNTVFSYTDIAAGPGKIWVGPEGVDGKYIDHSFGDGSITVWCDTGEPGCCVELLDGGRHLRLHDSMPARHGENDLMVNYQSEAP